MAFVTISVVTAAILLAAQIFFGLDLGILPYAAAAIPLLLYVLTKLLVRFITMD